MIGKLFSRDRFHQEKHFAHPLYRPQRPVCIIGDIHGRLDLLEAMFTLINAQPGATAVHLVFVGDMIDRGLESAAVLRRLHNLCMEVPDRITCLAGNHERMFLDFLSNPTQAAQRWISTGGNETLSSFGIASRVEGGSAHQRFTALAEVVTAALPPGMRGWLDNLPLFWQEGNLAVVHAAADPSRSMDTQSAEVLQWGHRAFGKVIRSDDLWIAHGHTIVPTPLAEAGRIAIDTGAWRTGRLSAAWLDAEGLRFLEAIV